jgi:hypothetical protein
LNFVLCISVDLIVNVRQIIAVASILSVSKNEHLHAPLFEWLLAYTIGAISIGIAITKSGNQQTKIPLKGSYLILILT